MMFAYSTILGWSLYGTRCIQYLFGMKAVKPYQIFFCIIIVVGCVSPIDAVWDIADTFNGLMALPNLIALVFLSGQVARITKNYFDRKNGKNVEPMLSVYPEQNEEFKADIEKE